MDNVKVFLAQSIAILPPSITMSLEIPRVPENALMTVNAMEIENVWKEIVKEMPERQVTIETAMEPITHTMRT